MNCKKHQLPININYQFWNKDKLEWQDGCEICYRDWQRFCVDCKFYHKKDICKKCLQWPRERPLWTPKGKLKIKKENFKKN